MFVEFLKSRIFTFRQDTAGAVTVDWVVLTAATMLLVLLVMPFIWTGLDDAGTDLDTLIATSLDDF